MELTNTKDKPIYQEEAQQYIDTLNKYLNLTDVDYAQAFELMQTSAQLKERFSEIHFKTRRIEKLTGDKDAALKDRLEQIYKMLGEIHTGCRMIWARGKEERLG